MKTTRVRSIRNGRLARFLKRLLGEQKGEYIIIVLLVGIALFALFLTFSEKLQPVHPHIFPSHPLSRDPPEIFPSHAADFPREEVLRQERVLKTAEEAADSFNGAN